MALRLARKDSVETKRGWQLDMNHANSRKVNERKRMVSHITKDDSTSDNTVLLLRWQTNGDMYKKKKEIERMAMQRVGLKARTTRNKTHLSKWRNVLVLFRNVAVMSRYKKVNETAAETMESPVFCSLCRVC